MTRPRMLAGAVVLLVAGGTFAALFRDVIFRPVTTPPQAGSGNPKEPTPPDPRPRHEVVLEAWNRAGFEPAAGRYRYEYWHLYDRSSPDYYQVFVLRPAGFVPAHDGSGLPDFDRPFGLDLTDAPLTAADLQRLSGLKNLIALYVRHGQVTDEILGGLSDAGLVHTLWCTFPYVYNGNYNGNRWGAMIRPRAKTATEGRPGTDAEIVSLDLSYTSVTGPGLAYLAGLEKLTALALRGTKLNDAGPRHLAGLKNLTSLDLQATPVTDEGLKNLSRLRNLTWLDLHATPATGAGLKHLAGLDRLTTLRLDQRKLTDDGLAGLAEADLLHTIGERGELARWFRPLPEGNPRHDTRPTRAEEVVSLCLPGEVTGKGLKHLGGLKNLTCLELLSDGSQLTDESLEALVGFGLLHALDPQAEAAGGRRPTRPEEVVALRIPYSRATGRSLKHVAVFKNLTYLDVRFDRVTDADLESVAALGHLKVLELGYTEVTDAGLKHLAGLKNLTRLTLYSNGVTRPGVAELQKALPNCTIARY